jgi:integrase
VTEQSKHPAEKGLRKKNGRWEYRFKLHGKMYSRATDLEAVPANILEAQAQKAAHLEEVRKGKRVVRQISVSLDQAVPKFMAWYRSEHQNRKCGWAGSLMASFQFYFEEKHCLLTRIGPGELEDFKMWRRENDIHDNTLRKQLLLLGQFFKYSRKQGWLKNDPFAKGDDEEVKIPREQDSGIMRVLSPKEEELYLAAAKLESLDLADVAAIMLSQGPRPDEVLSLQQDHVDLFKRRFMIWDNTGDGKSNNAHRTLKMTDDTFSILGRRLSKPGVWVFPSTKVSGPRSTLQKAHHRATCGRKKSDGTFEGGCGIQCRLYDMRHTFATRFALGGGSLPLLAKILGHADLSLLMRYVHPSQADMDRGMEWYNGAKLEIPSLESMLVEDPNITPQNSGVARPPFRPPSSPKVDQRQQLTANWTGRRKGI